MTNQSSASSDCSKPDATDVAASADKVAEERQRLATLIGRMLARHWLHHQPAVRDEARGAQQLMASQKSMRSGVRQLGSLSRRRPEAIAARARTTFDVEYGAMQDQLAKQLRDEGQAMKAIALELECSQPTLCRLLDEAYRLEGRECPDGRSQRKSSRGKKPPETAPENGSTSV